MHCQILSVKNDQKGSGQIDFKQTLKKFREYVYHIGGVKTGEIERWVLLDGESKTEAKKETELGRSMSESDKKRILKVKQHK